MRKVLLGIGAFFISIGVIYGNDYATKKRALAPENESKSILTAHNDYIGIQLNSSNGKFNMGTYPEGKTLIYDYNGTFSDPWSSWTVFKVDGELYTNHFDHSGIPDGYISPSRLFSKISHSGDSSYFEGAWTIEGVDITQIVMPVYLKYASGTEGTALIKYEIANNDDAYHTVGILLELDTKIGMNDAAPLATIYGYSDVEKDFVAPNIPAFWFAYEDDVPPASGDLIAMGILDAYEATPPDRFAIGQWKADSWGIGFYNVAWQYTIQDRQYEDSAVLLWWYPVDLAPGETTYVATYYGLGRATANPNLTLTVPPEVGISACDYVDFNTHVIVSNRGPGELDSVRVIITLPTGLQLAPGEQDTIFLSPSSVPAGGSRTVFWQVEANGADTGWMPVQVTMLSTTDSSSIVDSIYVPPILGRPAATIIYPEFDSARTSCDDLPVKILIDHIAPLNTSSIHFAIDGGISYFLSDPELTLVHDTLIFTPSTPCSEGAWVSYGLMNVADTQGCALGAPVINHFFVDTTPPAASNEYPADDAIISTVSSLPHFTVQINDDSDVDPDSILLEVNGTVYDVDGTILTWDGLTLEFKPRRAGLKPADGDTFTVSLLSAADAGFDYCSPNKLFTPYSWEFYNVILDLSIPDTFGYIGDTIIIPVIVKDELEPYDITSLSFSVVVDPRVIVPIGIKKDGSIIATWSAVTCSLADDEIYVDGNGSALSGSGALVFIKFYVNDEAIPGDFSSLNIMNGRFNDGDMTVADSLGTFRILWTFTEWAQNLLVKSTFLAESTSLTFGVSDAADSFYNAGLDSPYVVFPKLTAYFQTNDTISGVDKLSKDFRNTDTRHIMWKLHVDVAFPSTKWFIKWNSSAVPEGIFLIHLPSGESKDMKELDSLEFAGTETLKIEYSKPDMRRIDYTLSSGWNLISFSHLPVGLHTFRELFPGIISHGIWYNPETRAYQYENSPAPGKGYWIFVPRRMKMPVVGPPVRDFYRRIYTGWNLIGPPYSPIGTTASADLSAPDLVFSTLVYYEPSSGYVTSPDEMMNDHGYWCLGLDTGIYEPLLSAPKMSMGDPGDTLLGMAEVSFKILHTDGVVRELTAGLYYDSEDGYDRYDKLVPPPPPEGKCYSAFTEPTELGDLRMWYDVKKLGQRVEWAFALEDATELFAITPNLPPDYDYYFQIGADEFEADQMNILLMDDSMGRLMIYKTASAEKLLMTSNSPNPFVVSTVINYYLPEDSDVKITLWNISGKMINTLVDDKFQGGEHSLEWTGNDSDGNLVPPGIYFYQLETDDETITSKMLFIK